MKATYYNFKSVRDQVHAAEQNKKCDKEFTLPEDIVGISINNNWITKCSDPCISGWCLIHLHIKIPKTLPKQVSMYYVKEAPIAYVTFFPSILDFLKREKILDPKLLKEEKNAPKILPGVAP